MAPNDWYPYYADVELIDALREADVPVAKCRIAEIVLCDGRSFDRAGLVCIWGRDHKAFHAAVSPHHRCPIAVQIGSGQEVPDLAALAAELERSPAVRYCPAPAVARAE